MSVEAATDYVRRMTKLESDGPGDIDNALRRIGAKFGLGFWTLWHLRKGKAKSIDSSVYARIRGAYLEMCATKASNLLHEINIEAAAGDEANRDLADRLEEILAEVHAKRRAMSAIRD
jgi:hypothetical protein